jgi:hypothetical protein
MTTIFSPPTPRLSGVNSQIHNIHIWALFAIGEELNPLSARNHQSVNGLRVGTPKSGAAHNFEPKLHISRMYFGG